MYLGEMSWGERKTGVQAVLLISIGSLFCLSACEFHAESEHRADVIRSNRPDDYQKITGGDIDEERDRWNQIFRRTNYVFGREPNRFLRDHVQALPRGRALVFPMEEGRNAVFLAKRGFDVVGIDFSDVALQKAKRMAKEEHVALTALNADLNEYEFEPDTYDAIVGVDLYRPRLIEEIKAGLKRGGVVLYEVLTSDQLKIETRNIRRDFLVAPGELRRKFSDFEVLSYRETVDGKRAVATILARKP
jgi:SAM-dependent methyltransferase